MPINQRVSRTVRDATQQRIAQHVLLILNIPVFTSITNKSRKGRSKHIQHFQPQA